MGERIRQLREERGLCHYRLAHMIHCRPISIMLWEDGNTIPKARSLDKLARYFGVSVDYIINGGDAV